VYIMTTGTVGWWASTLDINRLLEHVLPPPRERRRRVLLCCAFARQVWHLLQDEGSQPARQVVEAAELWSDGIKDGGSVFNLVYRARDDCRLSAGVTPRRRRRAAPDGSLRPEHQQAAALAARDLARQAAVSVFEHEEGNPRRVAFLVRQAIRASLDVERSIRSTGGESRIHPEDLHPAVHTTLAGQCAIVRDIIDPPLFRDLAPAKNWLNWDGGAVARLARGITLERNWEAMPILHDALDEAGCGDPAYLGHCLSQEPHHPGCWLLSLLTKNMGLE
jgi:hypothetical protein